MGAVTAAARHATVTEHSPISPEGAWRNTWTISIIAAFGLYLVGIAILRGTSSKIVVVVVVALAVQLLPLAGPLLLSTDVYSYWDYGRLAAVHHVNPYETPPSQFPTDPAYPLMGSDWQEKTTVYGPAFTAISEGHARLVGVSANTAQLVYRVLAALAVCAIVVLVAARTGSAFATAFVGWSPLLALHFGGGGHNDALMAVALVGAMLFAADGRRQAEGAAWAVASAIKIVPLVFLPLRLVEAHHGGRRFGYRGLILAALALAALGFALYDWHWLTIFTPVANQLRSSSSLGLPYWAGKAGIPEGAARLALLIGFAAAYVWLLLRARRRQAEIALAAGLLLVATAWLQPWYAIWVVPLAALEEDWRARGLALLLTAYFLRDALPL
jgi:hypothetical protein